MENYELHIDTSPKINRINGYFLKGHIPFNKGVPMKRWMAWININRKQIHLGYFDNEIKAAKIRDIASKKYFGEFAILNFK
jgi:hypothetical protein